MLVTRIASKVIKLPSVLKPKKVTNTAPVSIPSLKPELARDTVELKNTVAEVFGKPYKNTGKRTSKN